MQKLKVLIAGSALDSVRLVEVVISVPVSVLMPALIETMQLPQTDLFGKEINYTLRFAKDGRAIAPNSTLGEAGVTLGARLILDSYVNEGVTIPPPSVQWQFEQFAPGAEQLVSGAEQVVPYMEPLSSSRNEDIDSMVTLTGTTQFSDPQYPLDLQMGDRAGWPGSSEMRGPGIIQKRKPGPSRRAFLVAAGIICGVGGLGLSYAAYRTFTNEGLKSPVAEQPPLATRTNIVPKVQSQSKPALPMLPTSAKLRFTFTKHTNNVRAVSWSPDGKMLASCADDKHALIWGINGIVHLDIQHPGAVRALAWSPDGQRLVTGADNQVTFFNVQTGAILASSVHQHTQIVTSIAWIARNQMQVVSGGADKQAIVWDTKTYRATTMYKQHTASIDVVSCSVNGKTVASSADNGFVRIWNVADGKDVHGYYLDVARPLRSMAFAPDGIQLAVGGDDGIVRIWNALTCKNDGQRCMDEPQRLHITQMPVRTIAWSPDGHLLAVGGNDGTFSVWNLMQTQNQQALFSIKQNDIVRSLAWSPDGKQLACASGNSVSTWDLI